MGLEPRDELDLAEEILDERDSEAIAHEPPPDQPLADAKGLGADLPEADTLDQRLEEPLDDDER